MPSVRPQWQDDSCVHYELQTKRFRTTSRRSVTGWVGDEVPEEDAEGGGEQNGILMICTHTDTDKQMMLLNNTTFEGSTGNE